MPTVRRPGAGTESPCLISMLATVFPSRREAPRRSTIWCRSVAAATCRWAISLRRTNGAISSRREHGNSFAPLAARVFSHPLVEQMAKHTRKASKGKAGKTRKGKRAQTPWMKKVMECYHRMKKTNKNVRLGDAMKQAKKEMA